jgi:hypothetical protein
MRRPERLPNAENDAAFAQIMRRKLADIPDDPLDRRCYAHGAKWAFPTGAYLCGCALTRWQLRVWTGDAKAAGL